MKRRRLAQSRPQGGISWISSARPLNELPATVLVDMCGEGLTGCGSIVAGFLRITKEDIISVFRAYADILIQDGYSVRILLRGLLVCRRECLSFWTHCGPPCTPHGS